MYLKEGYFFTCSCGEHLCFFGNCVSTQKETPSSKTHPSLYLFLWSVLLDHLNCGSQTILACGDIDLLQIESQDSIFYLLFCHYMLMLFNQVVWPPSLAVKQKHHFHRQSNGECDKILCPQIFMKTNEKKMVKLLTDGDNRQ